MKKEKDKETGKDQFIGVSKTHREIINQINTYAKTQKTVLIIGETGTGKELIAGAILYNSERKDGPFKKINCAALTETLLESELFGHEKGAFTGATYRKNGKFELAHKGTIFLDEIGAAGKDIASAPREGV